MKRNANMIELLVWSAIVSFVIMAPAAHSQSATGPQLFGGNGYTGEFDMTASAPAAPEQVENSGANTGVYGNQTIQGPQIVKTVPGQMGTPSLYRAANGIRDNAYAYTNPGRNANITGGYRYGYTSMGGSEYSYGFDGIGASLSPFNTGLPVTGTGSLNLDITNGY
ncbi:MAG TPA: hypothetical protein V6C76_13565 [Drouetiella sp.]